MNCIINRDFTIKTRCGKRKRIVGKTKWRITRKGKPHLNRTGTKIVNPNITGIGFILMEITKINRIGNNSKG
jgi:hypothetical protein